MWRKRRSKFNNEVCPIYSQGEITKMKLFRELCRQITILVAIATLLSGCAYTYVDAKGNRNIIGLVKIKIPPNYNDTEIGGDSVEITSAGLSFYSTQVQKAFVIGYGRESITTLRNNALLIDGDLSIDASTKNTKLLPQKEKNND